MSTNIKPISEELKSQSYKIALRLTFIIFISLSIIFLWFQIQRKSRVINQKIKIDQELLVNSIKIGDIFFITKYLDSFVETNSSSFVGIYDNEKNEWLKINTTVSSVDTIDFFRTQVSLEETQLPQSIKLFGENSRWSFRYFLKINHNFLLISLLLSFFLCVFLFYVLKNVLSSISKYFTSPIENLAQDLGRSDDTNDNELNTSLYEKGKRFYETEILMLELRSLISRINIQQDELKNTEVLKALNKLARQVSHDIQSPLGAIKASIENINQNPEASVRLINKALVRMDSIIGDLSVVQPNEINKEKEIVNLSTFIAMIVEEKAIEYKKYKKIVIINFISSTENIFCKMSKSRIARCISNIINNGIEAVEVDIARINITLRLDGGFAVLSVEDNGKGIESHLVTKVLQDGYSQGKLKGTGFGLSFADQVAKEHGGAVAVKSIISEGSVVSISLPAI